MSERLSRPQKLPCGAVLKNRIAKAAMTEGLADPNDNPSERHERLYRRWSRGGAGLLITGNVMIDRRYLERPGNVVIDHNSGEEALARWAEAGTVNGNHLWMQISHPGRQCSRTSNWKPVAPSDVKLKLVGLFSRPRAMTEDEIEDAIAGFARVAGIAKQTGFTGVQIHAAHGYLISQFLSPVTNQRDDKWGGGLGNRARFLLRTVEAVRKMVGPEFPVSVKLNSADFQKGGWSLEDCMKVVQVLGQSGLDLLEISGGTYEQPRLLGHDGEAETLAVPQLKSTREREAYFLEYARAIRSAARVPLMVTGGFRSRAAMEEALQGNELDVIGMARPLCVDPQLPSALLGGREELAHSWENELALGRGWLGPRSKSRLMKFINIQGQMAWFYRQIILLGDGESPDTERDLGAEFFQHMLGELRRARARTFRPRRHKRREPMGRLA